MENCIETKQQLPISKVNIPFSCHGAFIYNLLLVSHKISEKLFIWAVCKNYGNVIKKMLFIKKLIGKWVHGGRFSRCALTIQSPHTISRTIQRMPLGANDNATPFVKMSDSRFHFVVVVVKTICRFFLLHNLSRQTFC